MRDYTACLVYADEPRLPAADHIELTRLYNEKLIQRIMDVEKFVIFDKLDKRMPRNRTMFMDVMKDGLIFRTHELFKDKTWKHHYEQIPWEDIDFVDTRNQEVTVRRKSSTFTKFFTMSAETQKTLKEKWDVYQQIGTIPKNIPLLLEGWTGNSADQNKKTSDNPAWTVIKRVVGGLVSVVVGLIGLLVVIGLFVGQNRPICKVSKVEVKPDVFIVNDEPDAGFSIYTTIENTGKQGEIKVNARLESSEGNFARVQSYTFAENSVQQLKIGFHEPTVNATNIQGLISCSP